MQNINERRKKCTYSVSNNLGQGLFQQSAKVCELIKDELGMHQSFVTLWVCKYSKTFSEESINA